MVYVFCIEVQLSQSSQDYIFSHIYIKSCIKGKLQFVILKLLKLKNFWHAENFREAQIIDLLGD